VRPINCIIPFHTCTCAPFICQRDSRSCTLSRRRPHQQRNHRACPTCNAFTLPRFGPISSLSMRRFHVPSHTHYAYSTHIACHLQSIGKLQVESHSPLQDSMNISNSGVMVAYPTIARAIYASRLICLTTSRKGASMSARVSHYCHVLANAAQKYNAMAMCGPRARRRMCNIR
jgi:hypothetical protein